MSKQRTARMYTDEGNGRDPDRVSFDQLCRQLERDAGDPPHAIAVSALDRLFRNRPDRDRIEALFERGVDVLSAREEINTENPEDRERYNLVADWLMLAYEGEGVPPALTRIELIDAYIDRLAGWLQVMGAAPRELYPPLADVRTRLVALAFAWDDKDLIEPLLAPWFELAVQHEPKELSLELRALALAGVRSTELETLHLADHIDQTDWRPITQAAAFSFARFDESEAPPKAPDDPFSGLLERYPHAAAAFRALASIGPGERRDYSVPDSPAPELPTAEVAAKVTPEGFEVMHATDPRFSERGAEGVRQCIEAGRPMLTPALKHLSRNPAKLYRIVDVLLGHGRAVVTSHLELRPGRVAWRGRTGNYNELDVGWTGLAPVTNRDLRPGRNDQCPCGSGKKFKRCCGRV
jgi:SEC-C motif/Resolvase, N terminal domain